MRGCSVQNSPRSCRLGHLEILLSGPPSTVSSWRLTAAARRKNSSPENLTHLHYNLLGEDSSGAGPLTPAPLLPVSALIGGVPALVQFAGEAPGLVSGVLQVNVQIPANAPTGNVPIWVSIGTDSTQQGVTVSVQ